MKVKPLDSTFREGLKVKPVTKAKPVDNEKKPPKQGPHHENGQPYGSYDKNGRVTKKTDTESQIDVRI